MYRNNKNISIKGLFLGIVLCLFFASCDTPEKGEVVTDPMPSFGGEAVGNQQYEAGSAILTLTLPAATGGDLPLRQLSSTTGWIDF